MERSVTLFKSSKALAPKEAPKQNKQKKPKKGNRVLTKEETVAKINAEEREAYGLPQEVEAPTSYLALEGSKEVVPYGRASKVIPVKEERRDTLTDSMEIVPVYQNRNTAVSIAGKGLESKVIVPKAKIPFVQREKVLIKRGREAYEEGVVAQIQNKRQRLELEELKQKGFNEVEAREIQQNLENAFRADSERIQKEFREELNRNPEKLLQIPVVREVMSSQKGALNRMKDRVNRMRQDVEKLVRLEQKLKETNEVFGLRGKSITSEGVAEKLVTQHREALKQIDELTVKIGERESEVISLTERGGQLTAENQKRVAELQNEITNSKNAIESRVKEIGEMEMRFKSQEKESLDFKFRAAKEIEGLKNSQKDLAKEKFEVESQLSTLEMEYNTLKSTTATEQSVLKQKLDSKKLELQNKQKALDDALMTKDALGVSLETQTKAMQELQEAFAPSKQRIENLQGELQKVSASKAGLQEKVTNLEMEISQLRLTGQNTEKLQENQLRLKKAEQELKDTKLKLTDSEKSVKDYSEKMKDYEKLKEFQTKYGEKIQTYISEQKQITDLTSTVQRIEQEKAILKRNAGEDLAKMDKFQKDIQAKENELLKLRSEETNLANQVLLDSRLKDIEFYKKESEALRKELLEATNPNEGIAKQLKEAKSENVELKEQRKLDAKVIETYKVKESQWLQLGKVMESAQSTSKSPETFLSELKEAGKGIPAIENGAETLAKTRLAPKAWKDPKTWIGIFTGIAGALGSVTILVGTIAGLVAAIGGIVNAKDAKDVEKAMKEAQKSLPKIKETKTTEKGKNLTE